MPEVAVVIPAGGVGSRFGARTPKQFLRLGTMPILAATVQHFARHPAFRADLLREAHEKARRDGVVGTDDAMLVERLGHPVRVVRGLAENVKITTPEDLRRARFLAGR